MSHAYISILSGLCGLCALLDLVLVRIGARDLVQKRRNKKIKYFTCYSHKPHKIEIKAITDKCLFLFWKDFIVNYLEHPKQHFHTHSNTHFITCQKTVRTP